MRTRLLLLITALLVYGIGAGVLYAQEQTVNENKQEYVYRGYYIGDLMEETFPPKGFPDDDLPKMEAVANLIRSLGTPETWNEGTSIRQYINSGTLYIHQTESVHAQIKELLANLRKADNHPESHRIAPGDVLQIYIQTFTENFPLYPVVESSENHLLSPETGYIFPVHSDGTISLPKMLYALNVEGMTLEEAQSLLRRAYVDILRRLSSEAVITVSLISPGETKEQNPLKEPFICNLKVNFLPPDSNSSWVVEVSLQAVLDHIHEKTGISVSINDEALMQLGDPQEATVQAHLPFAMPLKNYLDYLTRKMDLAWHFKDGTIFITTADEISNPDNELILRIYYIRDLARISQRISVDFVDEGVREPADLEAIASYVRTMVEPKTWDKEKFLRVDYNSTIMLVNQTESVHEQIVSLLILMRKCQIGMSR